MAINLYRRGDSHKVRGISCEIVRCGINQMNDLLAAGCVKDPSELLNKTEQKAVTKALEAEQVNLDMDREFLQHG